MSQAHVFKADFARALLKALGLEGRKIRRIEMVFDVGEIVTATIYEYADVDQSYALVKVLEMGEWRTDVTAAGDDLRRYAKP